MSITDVLSLSERRADRDEEGARTLLAAAHSVWPALGLADLVERACSLHPVMRRLDPAVLAGIACEMNLPGIGCATEAPSCL